jgi:type I restriction enzyme S subunit
MNTIKQLIEKYCPEGVEYKKLGEVCNINRGVRVVRSDLQQAGEIPVYQNSLMPLGYFNKSNCPKESVFVISAGAAGDIGYSSKPFWAADDCLFFEELQGLQQKFIYYCLCSKSKLIKSQVRRASVPRLSRKVIENMIIPVPPIPVQREIVRILDNFTSLEAELEKQLEAELEARRKQYEYYRDQLLSFKHLTGGGSNEVLWKPLAQIAEIGTGSSNTNEGLEQGKYPFFVRSQIVRYKNSYEFDETAIITSGDGVGVGKIFHYIEGKYALHQRAYRIHIINQDVFPKFFFYYMKTNFYNYITKESFHSSVTSVRRPMLNKFLVPIPPLSVQHRIVSILDRFESSVNDISSGLSAEIAARHQQYEYYRDQLLTFRRK